MQLFADVTAPAGAPACFAAASVFSHDSIVCQACASFGECSSASVKTLEAIRQTINVEDLLRRHENARRRLAKQPAAPQVQAAEPKLEPAQAVEAQDDEVVPARPAKPALPPQVERKTKVEKVALVVTATDEEILRQLPVKAREHAERFCRAGLIDAMRKDLQAGRNTFAQSKPEFMRVICDRLIAGGASKSDLRASLMQQLNWSEGTASSHVSMAVPILLRFNIATESAGNIVLVPCV
ncbi:hypothetical protein C0Q88_07305 [Ralstonia pickettii]|uniref:Uncharacterized protein n=1 Tax=Ralstonia pickettii TaxID=329 RepID=A0A2N4TXS2_RALPI|nr:hypothetical protein [Ralstonia pickettii]PLC44478.1 hypothetical protein C0Q88_07305 [Ralstonia pickettii]